MPVPFPILAADVGTFIAAAFIVISFIGWIINQINAHNHPAPPRRGPRPARPRNERVQEEIDQFIQEATGRKKQPQVLSADEIEIVEPPRSQRRPPARRPAPAPAKERKPPARPRPGEDAAGRRLAGPEQLTTGLREHVRTYMEDRVATQVQRDLTNEVAQGVTEHLGAFAAQAPGGGIRAQSAPARTTAPIPAVPLPDLRDPAALRKAIVLNEVLLPPVSLRKQR
jgi:hypothetical protein